MDKPVMLDSFDLKLVQHLQVDSRRPVPALADAVGLSVPACYRRLRRLRDAGVIAREVAIVRPRTLGWPLSMVVLVMLDREGAGTIGDIIREWQAEPVVIEAWNITGDYDICARIIARDMEGYDELALRLFSADDRVRSFKTLVVIRTVKERAPVPVSPG